MFNEKKMMEMLENLETMMTQQGQMLQSLNSRVSVLENGKATKSTKGKSTKKSAAKQTKSAEVNIEDFAPDKWGNGPTGYTKLRKAYCYAVCGGKDSYDEAKYKAASKEFRDKYYDTLK